MCVRLSLHSSLRIAIALLIGVALLPVPWVSMLVSVMSQGHNQRSAPPRPGKPEGTFPDLGEVQSESQLEHEPPAPIPSIIRSQRNSGKPWDGRRVGDPEPSRDVGARGETLRAHARRMRVPPPLYEDQFIQNFFSLALTRSATYEETLYWNYQFRAAYNNSAESLKLAAIELGRTVFESAEYAARTRSAHWYVYDLYKTYLMRDPDSTGWANWETTVGTNGREYVRRGFEESTEFAGLLANILPSGPPSATASSLIAARVDPRNQPGNGILTRDANWSVPLLSLPGRAGLNLGLVLSYSSMVWTRSGPYIYFDEDNGFPSPGFRLGFPTVQRKVFDAQTGKISYLLITPSGRRVELRQVGSSNIYDAADSSYLRLTDNSSTLLVHSTDGTKLSFSEINGEFRCIEIKDRNGNYITVNNNALGRITTITDTLGRLITFNYDGNANLLSITQGWNEQPSHQWVGFNWGTRTVQSSFSNVAVVGTVNGKVLPVITQITLNDTSHNTFDYTNSLQVQLVRNYFGALQRSETTFTYEAPASDVPRLSDSRISANNWTGINGVPAQVITTYSVAGDGACVMTAPDGTIYKEYYGTSWQKGLSTLSEIWAGGVRQKWTTNTWTQDNTSMSYETNPRITETNVYDAGGNRRRTAIDYGPYAQYGLPYILREYAADAVTLIRETYTDYNLSQTYLDRRIIGLVSAVHLRNAAQYQRKITYSYDDQARLNGVPAAATQHDVNYNLSFTARGNVTAISRWDVTDINNAAKKLTTYTNYYNTGTPISTTDAAGHQSSITYADSFSDNVDRNTFAHPTRLIDADGFSSYLRYNFDFGATTRTESAAPAGQLQGAIQSMIYNTRGQLERVTTSNNGAYKRFWYGPDFVASYASVNNVADELYSVQVVDGLGRVIGAAGNHPGSTGSYRLVNTIYDQMGRVRQQSNPTEVNSSWAPSGDDSAGFYYTQQSYNWQGRPRVTTNSDGTTNEVSYAGCGCAGGAVVTATDEGTLFAGVAKRRQRKVYSDVLGRTVKSEVLNWQNGTVYSTTVNTYNPADQIEQIREYAGAEGSGTYQDTTTTYDGCGRLKTRHVPEQSVGAATTWVYNADDTVQTITDARGASAAITYNNGRHLPNLVTHALSGSSTIVESFAYDAAGNRTSMSDSSGGTTYQYNQLSQLTSETRTFTGLSGSYTLAYDYNYARQLKSLTDHTQQKVNYAYDTSGRLNNVVGTNYPSGQFINTISYRAWDAPRQITYGNGRIESLTYNSRLMVSHYEIPTGGGFGTAMSIDYQYYGDGRLKFSHDVLDNRFDRSYEYDHAARLTKSFSGAEARGEPATTNRPYKETATYDQFGHLNVRSSRHWSKTLGYGSSDTYTNNRRVGWNYDADGNWLSGAGRQQTYDAAGRNTTTSWTSGASNQFYDGDGQRVKATEPNVVTYYLRSTILGGEVIEELGSTGAKQMGFVYAGDKLIGHQLGSGTVSLLHQEPSGVSVRASSPSFSGVGYWLELDPWGAEVYSWDPYLEDPGFSGGRGEGGPVFPGVGDISKPSIGCSALLDGVLTLCDFIYRNTNGIGVERHYRDGTTERLSIDVFLGIIRVWHPGGRGNSSMEIDDNDVVRTNNNDAAYWEITYFILQNRTPQNPGFDIPGITNQVNAIL